MQRSCRWCEHVSMHGVATPEAFIEGVNRAFCVYGAGNIATGEIS